MKFNVILFGLFIFSMTSCQNPPDCDAYHTGSFSFEAKIDGKIEKTSFHRNDTIEISVFRGVVDTSKITWVNTCEYISKKMNPVNISEKKAIRFRIINTDSNGYLFEYNIVGDLRNIKRGFAIKTN